VFDGGSALDPRALRSAGACAILTVACWLSVIRAASAAAPDGGAIAGRVSDQTGAPLQGVAVSLTGQRHDSVVASATGEYRFDTLPAGRYALIFDFPGFAQQSRTGIAVIAGAVSRIDVVLQVSLHAEVSVTGKRTFRSFAEVDPSELSLVGLAPSASVGVVTSRQLEHRPIQRAADVLETIPGMAVTQHTGEGKATQYYLRGFNLDHGTDFATTVAGVPVNMPTHAHGHGYTDAGFLIPELVTGVQYFKGPYSADAGDFSSAGGATINYASQLDAPMLRVSAGGQGWARVLAAASPRVGSGQLLAAAELAHSDGPWTQPDDYRRYNAVLRYTRGDAANNLVLGALAYRGSWHSTDQAPQRAINDGMLPRFGAVDPTTGGDTGRYAASAEWQRTSSASRNRLTGYAVAYDLDLFSNFTYFLDDPVEGDQFHQADRRLVSGLRASHERLALAGERPVEYRVGAQVRRDDIGRVGLYRTRARQRLSTVREDAVD
jgi:Carboxypeptidase regulatory-like domain/TonB-dependent Receptor Plug Domain